MVPPVVMGQSVASKVFLVGQAPGDKEGFMGKPFALIFLGRKKDQGEVRPDRKVRGVVCDDQAFELLADDVRGLHDHTYDVIAHGVHFGVEFYAAHPLPHVPQNEGPQIGEHRLSTSCGGHRGA